MSAETDQVHGGEIFLRETVTMKETSMRLTSLSHVFRLVVAGVAIPMFLLAGGSGDPDLIKNNATDSGGCENEDANSSECPCADESEEDPNNGCVHVNLALGGGRQSALTRGIRLQLKELQATPALYSPDGFKVLAGYTIKQVSWGKTAAGLPRWVMIASDGGLLTDFYFADGESVGVVPAGPESRTRQKLAMVDAQGWATAQDPAWYDFYPGDGSRWRFGASKGAPDYLSFVEHQTPQGRLETKQDLGLEIVRDEEGVLRQVLTPSTLADFTVAGPDAYNLTVYPNDMSCVTGERTESGGFALAAGAEPLAVWRFRNPEPGVCKVLEVTREKPGVEPQTWRYTFVEAVNDFILEHPGGVREDRSERVKSDGGKSMVTRKEMRGTSGVALGRKEDTYVKWGYKYLRTKEVRDPGGLDLTTTRSYYSGGASDGLVSMRIDENGSWTRYEYDGQRRKAVEFRPWLDAPADAPPGECAATRYDYTLFASGDFLTFNDQRPRIVIEEICAVEVSRTYHAYPTNALGQCQEITEHAAFPGAPYGHPSNPRTVKTYHAAFAALPLPGRLASITYPGGRTESCGYEYGTFNAATFAFTPDPDGGAWRETVTTTYPSAPNSSFLTPDSTRRVAVWDEKGREVLNESYVADGDAFALIGWKRMSYDRNGKLVETVRSDGRIENATWGANCCGKESETSADGTITVYGYNTLKQKISETRKGTEPDGSGDITTRYTYDLEGNVLSVVVTNEASGQGYLDYTRSLDAVGRETNRIDRLGNATVARYAALSSTVIHPNGVTSITQYYLDGRTKRILENGTVKQSYAYGVNPNGTRWTLTAEGALLVAFTSQLLIPDSSLLTGLDFPWQIQITDLLGRTIVSHKPGFGGTVLVTSNAYDIAGNQLSTTQYSTSLNHANPEILSQTLHSYCADGSRNLTALDINTNSVIDIEGPDRVTGISTAYEKDASNLWWKVTRSWVYPEFNSVSAVTTTTQRVLLTGLGVPASQLPITSNLLPFTSGESSLLTSLSESIDIGGNATTSATFIDRVTQTANKIILLPTSVQPEMQTMVNGLLLSTVSSTAVTNTFVYDGLARRIATTDGRENTTTTAYNSLGQIAYTEDAASCRTTFVYDTFGRRTEVTDALGNTTHTTYDTDNRVIATWGATYPVRYSYDAQGRMIEMRTYRSETEGAGIPLATSGDATRWLYDAPTGLLINKLYADGLGPVYTYTPDGKLLSRLWARGILTSYAYDAVGALVSVNYSDNTPDITYTYNRLGNIAFVADASGTRAFTYTPVGEISTDTIQVKEMPYTLHEIYDSLWRSSGYALSNVVNDVSPFLVSGLTQSYDAFNRITSVQVAGLTNAFLYTYLPSSDLISSLAMPNGVTRETVYEPHHNQPASITHTNPTGIILTHRTFAYDTTGRLISRTQYRCDDEANRLDAFDYNLRSELTQAVIGTNNYAYLFDPIGNREQSIENSVTNFYAANNFNQYTSIISQPAQSVPSMSDFSPVFDADGNQTFIRTTTGIWHVTYNGENRPVCFSNEAVVVDMAYDYMGHRFGYKETVNNVVSRHEHYLYRNDLCIATLSLMNTGTNVPINSPSALHTVVWDPTESVASRPLLLFTFFDWHTYSFDQMKNVTELFNTSGVLSARYDYAPFGAITAVSGVAADYNALAFSSETVDVSLGLVYYNYRHLNVLTGRWIMQDPSKEFGWLAGLDSSAFKKIAVANNIKSIRNEYHKNGRDDFSHLKRKFYETNQKMNLGGYEFIRNITVNGYDFMGLFCSCSKARDEACKTGCEGLPGTYARHDCISYIVMWQCVCWCTWPLGETVISGTGWFKNYECYYDGPGGKRKSIDFYYQYFDPCPSSVEGGCK